MTEERSWQEFIDSGLFWWTNTLLHTFGWSLVAKYEGEHIVAVYPARVKFRGFSERINSAGYVKVAEHLKDNADQLAKEAKE